MKDEDFTKWSREKKIDFIKSQKNQFKIIVVTLQADGTFKEEGTDKIYTRDDLNKSKWPVIQLHGKPPSDQ